jgi:hypothetical protein
MASRESLQEELIALLGSSNVYYDPPENLQMEYPCFIYTISQGNERYADNKVYRYTNGYDITYVDANQDSAVLDAFRTHFQMSKFNRHYVADELHHTVLIVYW